MPLLRSTKHQNVVGDPENTFNAFDRLLQPLLKDLARSISPKDSFVSCDVLNIVIKPLTVKCILKISIRDIFRVAKLWQEIV